MYIDSPQFPRRKVVGQGNQWGGGYGFERIQLANFVADQLNNNHRDDAAILEKFRKQAEQYKRNLLHRRHKQDLNIATSPSPGQKYIQEANSPIQNNSIKNQSPQMYKRKIKQPERVQTSISQQNQAQIQQKPKVSPTIVREIVKLPDAGHKQLIKMLDRKDRQLQKQSKIIKRSEQKINHLKKKLEVLQYQNKIKEADRIAKLQQNSYQQIKGYISSMSQRLLQNQGILSENLSQIKIKSKNSDNYHSVRSQVYQPTSPQPLKKQQSRKLSHPYTNQIPDNYEQNPEPKITYNYKIGNQQKIKQQKFGLNSIISNLGSNRNRLDKLGSYI